MRRVIVLTTALMAVAAPAAGAKVLLVGSFQGVKGHYQTIQAAANAANPGDWILVGPGDYKTRSSNTPPGAGGQFPAGVLISKVGVRLRGMNRNTVIVDGTTTGPPCNDIQADQNFGPNASGAPAGLNGIMVWKADNVWVQNLTACNFLGGSGGDGGTGNEIWWNGGAGSGQVGGWGYLGSYLTATSTWFDSTAANPNPVQAEASAAQYGIFSSNWSGGTWNQTYASNMNDSGYYIGACQQVCDQTVNHAWSEYNALGYSGSNSGGQLLVENSQFDNNEDGFDTNSQNGDNPPPQDGECPGGATNPLLVGVQGADPHSCWVFMDNYVHDNNDPNVPSAGSAAAGPVGTGMSISGGRYDTVLGNTFANNDAWGAIFVPYPDNGPPCTGGTGGQLGAPCIYDEYGDALLDNTFANNGSWGNPTNGDFGMTNFEPAEPNDCMAGNTDTNGTFTSAPSNIESMYPTCSGDQVAPSDTNPQSAEFTTEVACDSQISFSGATSVPCLPGSNYPRMDPTKLVDGLQPLPPASEMPSMPNPCTSVPANPWCASGKPIERVREARKANRST